MLQIIREVLVKSEKDTEDQEIARYEEIHTSVSDKFIESLATTEANERDDIHHVAKNDWTWTLVNNLRQSVIRYRAVWS